MRTPVTQVVAAGEYRLSVDVAAGRASMEQGEAAFGPLTAVGSLIAVANEVPTGSARNQSPSVALSPAALNDHPLFVSHESYHAARRRLQFSVIAALGCIVTSLGCGAYPARSQISS